MNALHVTHDEVDLTLVVESVCDAADGVKAITLRRLDGADLPQWSPGAHTDMTVGGLVRQYSLCGDPADSARWRIAVLREVDGRGGSAAIHGTVRAGDILAARGPRNNFALTSAPAYVFIAGGIGITPLLPMVAAVHTAGAQWRLVMGGRTRASMAFVDELTSTYGDRVDVRPHDETGLLPLDTILADAPDGAAIYCCGPEPLLRAVENHCAAMPSLRLHVERFAPKQDPHAGDNEEFEVELESSGQVLTVGADTSVLEVLESAGVPVLSSCREGTCGTCETEVVEGVVDHRDSLLTEEERAENDVMFVCVSRAACPRLVLAL
ncbi:PDR/VanB family oxidoreductase [Rudaeicoccus suwonensis]|uniref:Ferredoxin-NADP reductase n=1 Tax=Rudaeicoccus suwonensis TaxID=657409 RepID=A0A561E359_9MICO|nr:PDR/VanB family oxidoreductase [Rudaeicoccus suwonensis]TWE10048.1 ferredoxin-NADP reductase [Rudaeicoccus suwonensis]